MYIHKHLFIYIIYITLCIYITVCIYMCICMYIHRISIYIHKRMSIQHYNINLYYSLLKYSVNSIYNIITAIIYYTLDKLYIILQNYPQCMYTIQCSICFPYTWSVVYWIIVLTMINIIMSYLRCTHVMYSFIHAVSTTCNTHA